MKLLRSYLFAPGGDDRLLLKALEVGADAVVFDLEDAVSESGKIRARTSVAARLRSIGPEIGDPANTPPVFVRINGLDSNHWRDDIDAVAGPAIAGVRVPKIESIESLCRLNDALSDRERSLGLVLGSIPVVATIESARGIGRLESIAVGPRLSGFTFGASDFCADIGADPDDEAAVLLAQSSLVLASRRHRLAPPVASVFTRLGDDAGLLADTQRHKSLGFFGRSAVHPRQIPVIHAALEPTPAELTRAEAVVAAYARAEGEGRGALQDGGDFIDLAIVRRARALLARRDDHEEDQE